MSSILHSIKEIASFINTLLIIILLTIIFGFMMYSIFYITPYINHPNFVIPIYIVLPFPILLLYLHGIVSYIWYIFLGIAISVSSMLMLIYGIIPYYSTFIKKPFSYRRNPFQEMAELYAVNIFFSMLIVFIFLLAGYIPQTPGIGEMPPWAQMLGLLHASVYEELIVRTLFLGIPVFIVYILKGKKVSPWRIFGGYGKITHVEVTFIIISAIIFALAHIPAWNVWKVMPTFIAGLILGYLYIRYGIYASIMLHFMTDFISIPMTIYPQYQYLLGLFMIVFGIAGAVFFISYILRIINYFTKKKKIQRVTPKKTNITSQNPWTTLTCPNCGGKVFQYVDENTVKCVNCGTIVHLNRNSDDDQTNYFI